MEETVESQGKQVGPSGARDIVGPESIPSSISQSKATLLWECYRIPEESPFVLPALGERVNEPPLGV